MTAVEKNNLPQLTRFQEEIRITEGMNVPRMIDINGSAFYCDPNSARIEYKGTYEDDTLKKCGTYGGAVLLTEIFPSYSISIVREIVEEAQSQVGRFSTVIDFDKSQIEPGFEGCTDIDGVKNRLFVTYDLAQQNGWGVFISEVNKSIIRNPFQHIS